MVQRTYFNKTQICTLIKIGLFATARMKSLLLFTELEAKIVHGQKTSLYGKHLSTKTNKQTNNKNISRFKVVQFCSTGKGRHRQYYLKYGIPFFQGFLSYPVLQSFSPKVAHRDLH